MKKKLGPILIVIVIIIAVFGATYSWWIWRNSENEKIGVDVSTGGASADCIAYSTTNSGNKILIPTSVKENGYLTTIEIAQTCNVNFYVDFNLKLTKLPAELIDASFKYTLVENNTIISEDNFSGKVEGQTLKIASRELLITSPKTYLLYLWIDGNVNDDNKTQNQEYQFDLEITITDEIEE